MYALFDTRAWRPIAVIVLFAMSFVFVFHALIPHEHPHDLLPLGPFGILHTGMAEKFFVMVALVFAFLVTLPDMPSLDPGRRLATKRGVQSFAADLCLLYRILFRKGIVHMNQR